MNPIKLEYKEVTINNQTFLEPLLEVEDKEYLKPLGRFGKMRFDYLKEHNDYKFRLLQIESVLLKHCHKMDEECWNRIKIIETNYLNSQSKAIGFVENVIIKTQARNIAVEIIKNELIFI